MSPDLLQHMCSDFVDWYGIRQVIDQGKIDLLPVQSSTMDMADTYTFGILQSAREKQEPG